MQLLLCYFWNPLQMFFWCYFLYLLAGMRLQISGYQTVVREGSVVESNNEGSFRFLHGCVCCRLFDQLTLWDNKDNLDLIS